MMPALAAIKSVRIAAFFVRVDWSAPQPLALRLGALQPLLYPLADHRALELGEHAHQLEQLEIREEEEK
jgi:hypothetical protein